MNKVTKIDLLIIGGGIAGISAGYIASKEGLNVIVAEKNNYLGGLITGGLVIPSMKIEDEGINQVFFNDLIEYANKYNAQITYGDGNKGWFNPVMLKIVFDRMLKDSGCKVIFEAEIESFKADKNNIVELILKSNRLSLPIKSKYYLDATGNGSLARLLNCDFIQDNNEKQMASLRFIVSGVDLRELSNFLLEYDKDRNVTTSYNINDEIHLSTACTSNGEWALKPLFNRALQEGVLKTSDIDYFQIFTIAGTKDSVGFNCPRLKINENNIFARSNALIEARASMIRLLDFCKKYLKGFKNAYISNIADITGERENGRVKTKYIYTKDDILNGKKFKNTALCSDYPIDIHSKDGGKLEKAGKYYLPIESLMSCDYNNLYIAGKCLGADFEAQAALRVQQSCASMGEAVARYIINEMKRR